MPDVRTAVFDVFRSVGMTRLFANPGSTEVALLTDLPEDIDFVLALHEGSVVGMASGYALATGSPAAVLLHTTAGFGNAVGAIATARVNRAPLVILVGQQDRRHLVSDPFLAGKLEGLAGEYPVATHAPARAADVPGAVLRAFHEATLNRGPVIVIVPMSDWAEPADESIDLASPVAVRVAAGIDEPTLTELTAFADAGERIAVIAGPGADTPACWAALSSLAARLGAPVWQEAHGAQSGYPQDDPRFQGHLPPLRADLRATLAEFDTVLVFGAPAFRQGTWDSGRFVEKGTRVAVVTQDPAEAVSSAASLTVIGDVATIADALARGVRERTDPDWTPRDLGGLVPTDTSTMRAEHVYAAVARRLPPQATVLEESPSTRRLLLDLVPTRDSFGFLTVAQGGLGFALPAAAGIRLGRPERPVVAFIGDGASLYNIQGLWSTQQYGIGVLYVILSNGGYAVMDRLATMQGGEGPWPAFPQISVSRLAEGFGVEARRVESFADLETSLDEIVPTLGSRTTPLLLDVAVATG